MNFANGQIIIDNLRDYAVEHDYELITYFVFSSICLMAWVRGKDCRQLTDIFLDTLIESGTIRSYTSRLNETDELRPMVYTIRLIP